MKVKLNGGKAASELDIVLLQSEIGGPLFADFLEFVATNDGAKPETNIFKIETGNDSGVNQFIPVKSIHCEMKGIENLPRGSYPFAWAEGGNYVVINQAAGGSVFFLGS